VIVRERLLRRPTARNQTLKVGSQLTGLGSELAQLRTNFFLRGQKLHDIP
jgi:hypothetical protein